MYFPEWCYNEKYLPTLEELQSLGIGKKDDFSHHNPLGTPFQILNQEFISGLVEEIIKKIKLIEKRNIIILEVGAGNGRLSYFLKKELLITNTQKKVNVITTDDLSWVNSDLPLMWVKNIKSIPVEKNDVENSLRLYNPDIVISSWMVYTQDWTKFFRNSESVKYFIMIGNPCECGNRQSWSDCEKFEGQELNIKGNICWQDFSFSPQNSTSKIILFKRKT